jgi:polysaccharide export outer membrane protein
MPPLHPSDKENDMRNAKCLVGFICGVLALGAGCGSLFAQENPPPPSYNEYKIGPKDLLDIRVYGQDKLTAQVRVSELGRITLSLVDEVEVNGLTAAELEKKLAKLYEKWVVNPQVSVFIRELRSNRVSIVGAVQKPASYELLGRQTLLGLISEAGGLTKDVAKEIIILRMLADGSTIRLTVLVDDLMNKGDPKANIPLEPGDLINVQVDKAVQIYVFGQVKNPSALTVLRSNIPTLMQAIAQAGGFTERAKKSSVIVRRKEADGTEKQLRINVKDILAGKPDFQLQEGDTIYVEETWI